MVMVEDLVVAEGPPNMRNRSSTFRYRGLVYLADRSTMIRYAGGRDEIARYTGGGNGVGNSTGEDISKYRGKYTDGGDSKDLDKNLDKVDKDRVYFWYSSRRYRWSKFFDEKTISQCLQDGLLHIFSCVYCIKRAIEENEAL